MAHQLQERGRVLNRTNEGYARQIAVAARSLLASLRKGQTSDATDDEDDDIEADDDEPDDAATTKKSRRASDKKAREAADFSQSDTYALVQDAITKATGNTGYAYIQDVYEDAGYAVYRKDYSGGYFRVDFTIDASGAVTLGTPTEVVRKVTYIAPGATTDAVTSEAVVFDIEDDTAFVPLSEAAVSASGSTRIKLIAPGKGSSGYYPRDVLERDGPKVFKAGTKMFWNHATLTEEAERPEGDLDRLAAVLTEDARFEDDPKHGAGLYATAQVTKRYKEAVDELAPYIGTSIRASGRAKLADVPGVGRLPVIEAITAAKSVDFVTTPGAGGKVLSLFEAARTSAITIVEGVDEMDRTEVESMIREAVAPVQQENQRLREALALSNAERVVAAELAKYSGLPAITRQRLSAQLSSGATLNEAGQLDVPALSEAIKNAVNGELTYLREATGRSIGDVSGFGAGIGDGGNGAAPVDYSAELAEAFVGLGMSAGEAKIAANGRG